MRIDYKTIPEEAGKFDIEERGVALHCKETESSAVSWRIWFHLEIQDGGYLQVGDVCGGDAGHIVVGPDRQCDLHLRPPPP